MDRPCKSLVGQRLDRYDVLSLLGQGGFGAVYLARHAIIGSEVALKVLWADHADDPKSVERFFREARAAAAVGSENIVSVLDAGTSAEGHVFLAMEVLHGRDLDAELTERGPLPVNEVIKIARDVLSALHATHARGIIHRDMKPANIFLTKNARGEPMVKLLDFGISKVLGAHRLTKTGAVLGTPHYMAPEQLDAQVTVDPRADLHAVGVVMFELLTARLPFPGSGYDVLLSRVQGALPPRIAEVYPSVPAPLALVIDRALAPDRDARWSSAAQMLAALEQAAAGQMPELADVETVAPVPGQLLESWRPLRQTPVQATRAPRKPSALVKTALLPSSAPPPAHTQTPPLRGHGSASPVAVHVPASATPPRAPAKSSASLYGWLAIGGLGLVLAIGIGVLGALVLRIVDPPTDPPDEPPIVTPTVFEPSPVEQPTRPPLPPPPPPPPPVAVPTEVLPPPPPVRPARGAEVRYRVRRHLGAGSRAPMNAVYERARDDVARCGGAEPLEVTVQMIATDGGAITIARASDTYPSDDDAVADCVASAISSNGPAAFVGQQTAIVELTVNIPGG